MREFAERSGNSNDDSESNSNDDSESNSNDDSESNSNDDSESNSNDDSESNSNDGDNVRDIIDRFTGDSNDDSERSVTDDANVGNIIDRFTNGIPNFENEANNDEEEQPVTSQQHQPDDLLESLRGIGNGVIDNQRNIYGPLLQDFPIAQERLDEGLDRAQSALNDAFDRAKYSIQGSLPSGSGFN